MAATRSLAAERVRLLSDDAEPEPAAQARDPEQLRSQSRQVREQETALVAEITAASARLLESLVISAPPKGREVEAAKARARNEKRFGSAAA